MNTQLKFKHNLQELRRLQALPLEDKIERSKETIRCWYESWDGDVCISFSGGKDSTVLLHIVRTIYPKVLGVFSNTGLEYPEIVRFVKSIDNVKVVRPEMLFKNVIKKYGFPIISKESAGKIRKARNKNNIHCRNLYLKGYTSDGRYLPTWKLPKKWHYLIDAPFKISEKCCMIMKKKPMAKFQKEHNLRPYIGTMASDSHMREKNHIKRECNNLYDTQYPVSHPLSFWSTEDVWNYIKKFNLRYSSIYDKGYTSTGCMWCMFGVHLEKPPNRFQRMKETHPKHWNYCINKLGIGRVLDYIDVRYK